MKTRTTGVAVIALIFMLLGVFSLVWSGLVFGIGGVTSAVTGVIGADAVNAAASSGMWSGFLGLFGAVVQIAVGIGLLGMKTWSWYLAVIAIGISVVQGLVGMFNGGTFALLCGALWLLIPVGALVYLARGSMRERFGVGS